MDVDARWSRPRAVGWPARTRIRSSPVGQHAEEFIMKGNRQGSRNLISAVAIAGCVLQISSFRVQADSVQQGSTTELSRSVFDCLWRICAGVVGQSIRRLDYNPRLRRDSTLLGCASNEREAGENPARDDQGRNAHQ